MNVDTNKFVMVNRQNRPVTVYNSSKRQVRVAPISHIRPHQPWDRNGVYVLTDPYFAQYVGPAGPLYLMPRHEAEALMGADFPVEGAATARGQNVDATPVGESVLTQAAKTRPARGAVGTGAPVAAAVAAPVSTATDDGEGVELHTHAELEALKMPDLRAYAANWEIKGSSRQAIIDLLVEAACVAPPEDA